MSDQLIKKERVSSWKKIIQKTKIQTRLLTVETATTTAQTTVTRTTIITTITKTTKIIVRTLTTTKTISSLLAVLKRQDLNRSCLFWGGFAKTRETNSFLIYDSITQKFHGCKVMDSPCKTDFSESRSTPFIPSYKIFCASEE